MCSEGGSDASVGSEVSDSTSETTSETYDSSSELCENGDTYDEGEASEELVDNSQDQPEGDLVENDTESTDDENDDLQETEETEELEESDSSDAAADSEAVREAISEKSEYSEEVNDNISSVEELEVYQKAGLREESVDGKTCLVRDDIDWDQKDEFGHTNRQRVEEYDLVPYNRNGEKVELHHVGQKDDSPLAELSMREHRGKGSDSVLHDKARESEIDRPAFDKTRIAHWKSRAE